MVGITNSIVASWPFTMTAGAGRNDFTKQVKEIFIGYFHPHPIKTNILIAFQAHNRPLKNIRNDVNRSVT